MSVINFYYIIDAASLCELVSVSDTGGLNVKYFHISLILPQYQYIAYSQYFKHFRLSLNDISWYEWLREGRGNFKYLQLI